MAGIVRNRGNQVTVTKGKRRTVHTVREALVSLMRERAYSEITVQHVISKADVSRSTFYSHFDGKDDVLASHYTQFFDFVADACMQREGDSIRIAPMAFMLSHLSEGRYHDFYRGLRASGKLTTLRTSAVDRLSAKFERELVRLARDRSPQVPVQVIGRFVATTFMDLIEWWTENASTHTPAEMEAMFERLVKPAVDAALR